MRSILIALALVLVPGVAVAGNVLGPHTHVDIIARNDTDEYVMIYEGLSPGRITLRGDGSSDLDCYLYEGDRLAVKDDDATDTCFLSWFQVSSGKVRLRIKNRGAANRYRLETN